MDNNFHPLAFDGTPFECFVLQPVMGVALGLGLGLMGYMATKGPRDSLEDRREVKEAPLRAAKEAWMAKEAREWARIAPFIPPKTPLLRQVPVAGELFLGGGPQGTVTVPAGTTVLLEGPTASGKSTHLLALAEQRVGQGPVLLLRLHPHDWLAAQLPPAVKRVQASEALQAALLAAPGTTFLVDEWQLLEAPEHAALRETVVARALSDCSLLASSYKPWVKLGSPEEKLLQESAWGLLSEILPEHARSEDLLPGLKHALRTAKKRVAEDRSLCLWRLPSGEAVIARS